MDYARKVQVTPLNQPAAMLNLERGPTMKPDWLAIAVRLGAAALFLTGIVTE
jgi:hypothetical protein